MAASLDLVGLTKRFGHGHAAAVDNIDLSVASGEFFSLLGPSGCGKTTTLRLIAGFEEPSGGRILLDRVDVARLPPHRRPVNTVFQSYALFPFLDVTGNVGFGLRYQHLDKATVARKVGAALELVRLQGYERRRPSELSGGQQQRVALARALVLEPSVLLLDEPLGALDAKLRRSLQLELGAVQDAVGITFLYVTHDQEEALTMSDRLAVMGHGRVAQVGTPREVYEDPADAYVADFLGVSNLMDAQAAASGAFRLGDFTLRAAAGASAGGGGGASGSVKLSIRPERVRLVEYGAGGDNTVPGMVESVSFLGSATRVVVRLAPGPAVHALVPNDGGPVDYRQGTPVGVVLPADGLRVLPPGPAA
jgi:spermidine/putrescine transport system ATP-binding protein